MAEASAGTGSARSMSASLLERTKRISLARSKPTTTDCTFPAADVPELMVVLRDFIYGLDCAKVRRSLSQCRFAPRGHHYGGSPQGVESIHAPVLCGERAQCASARPWEGC